MKSKNYMGELYCEEGEEMSDVRELCKQEMKHESFSTPSPDHIQPCSLKLEKCQGTAIGSRDRSRSPLLKFEVEIESQSSTSSNFSVPKWAIGNDKLTNDPLDGDDLDEDVEEPQTLAQESHARDAIRNKRVMNGEPSQNEENYSEELQVTGRKRVLSGAKKRDQQSSSTFALTLQEIWKTDEEIAPELKDLEISRKRETLVNTQVTRDRAMRKSRANSSNEVGNRLLESENHLFEWFPMETFQPKEELFTPEHTGSVKRYWTPYDAFRSIWDDSVLEQIVLCTNQFACSIKSSNFQKEWLPTNRHEVMCLFAFWIMLGILRMPTIMSCFSTDPLLRTDIFRKIFTSQRYESLTRALSFANTVDPINSSTGSDKLYPLMPIISSLNGKFQENYVLSKDICIAESLTHWKGKLNIIRQYNSSKGEHGIKTIELCESATGYLWSFMVYTGKQKSPEILKIMVDPLFNKGYRLFMNNWENALPIARFLKRNGIDCVAAIQPRGQDIPVYIQQAPLKRGQFIARHAGDVCVLSWHDNKLITMISTCHGAAAGLPRVPSKPGSRLLTFKPQVVLDYNRSMGGVDLKDQMLEPYLLERKKCSKWYMKLFKRLLNVSISNARILMESSLQCPQKQHDFTLRLVDMILDNHLAQCPQPRRHAAALARLPDPIRKVPHIHWPVRVEDTVSFAARNRKTRVRCFVCVREGRKTMKTPFKCEACNVPLCVEGCFKKYHVAMDI
ncbi:hypothetical protein PYW07_007647 [Mythimna separata]|uniref:PiggyBac transposable element-derived protein domain-containing protein n=1 Tax=Mythimna separata TaxID=271217 RepID=A0AAD7YQ68_MYTSE|nr:hypothetical protein PYW07_007647 [Mythimna separata]